MKHAWLHVMGFCLFGMTALGSGAAGAATAAGFYYPIPSWNQTLPTATRFIVLTNMGNAAVLDRETGLVWEQSPSTTRLVWEQAQFHCNKLTTGGRLGWRLPTVQELSSLVDPKQVNPSLPSGHPFSNVQSFIYWSSTTANQVPLETTSGAWIVDFNDGDIGLDVKSYGYYLWCVRGGHGADPQ